MQNVLKNERLVMMNDEFKHTQHTFKHTNGISLNFVDSSFGQVSVRPLQQTYPPSYTLTSSGPVREVSVTK